jgi:hypothetical protein
MLSNLLRLVADFLEPPRRPGRSVQIGPAPQESRYVPPHYVPVLLNMVDAMDLFEQEWFSQFGVYYQADLPTRSATPQVWTAERPHPFSVVDVSDPSAECPICFSAFDGIQKAVRTRCKHVFHAHCIYEWIKAQKERDARATATCPCCRKDL